MCLRCSLGSYPGLTSQMGTSSTDCYKTMHHHSHERSENNVIYLSSNNASLLGQQIVLLLNRF